jgi:hypothetical protein
MANRLGMPAFELRKGEALMYIVDAILIFTRFTIIVDTQAIGHAQWRTIGLGR